MQIFRCIIAAITVLNIAVSIARAQSFVEAPVVKVIKEQGYTIYLRYYDGERVEVYTRVYDKPTEIGKTVINAIHIRTEEKPNGVLIYEHIYEDNYAQSLFFNRSKLYSITMDKYPNGKEAILVYRTKDRKLIAVIGEKESGEWDTENNDDLNSLIRKYHPELSNR